MGVTTHKILIISILTLLYGCNSEVFIEDFLPGDAPEVVVSQAQNTKEIHFKSDNWTLTDIIPIKTNSSISYLHIKAYTLDGNPTTFPLKEKEPGILHYTSDFIDFYVERRSGNTLKVILNENLMNKNAEMQVIVGNDYKGELIELVLEPTQKYQIDSVVYDWDKFIIYEGSLEQVESITVNNQQAATPINFAFYPFHKSVHKVRFYNTEAIWDEEAFKCLLGTTLPQITIPTVVDSQPVLANTKVFFGISSQDLEANLNKELSVNVTIDGGDIRNVIVFNEMEKYSVPYKVYLSNSHTNKKRVFSGELHSSRPIDYVILKKRVDETKDQ